VVSTFKVTVVEWKTEAVEPNALEESGIRILEERLEELRDAKVEFNADSRGAV
jgi:hypothetical protein